MGTIIANMRTTIALLAFLGLAAASPMPMNNTRTWGLGGGPTGCTTSDTSFDYLLLVQQWPATQPSASWPTGADITDFTLHGLWPSRTGSDVNTYPCTCTSEQFDSSKVSSIATDMNAHWPSYTGNNNQFWSHEWGKHGTCCDKTAGLSDQLSFSSSALKFRESSALLASLTKAGFAPGGSYSYSNMSDAIKATTGVAPLMGCKTGNTVSEMACALTLPLRNSSNATRQFNTKKVTKCPTVTSRLQWFSRRPLDLRLRVLLHHLPLDHASSTDVASSSQAIHVNATTAVTNTTSAALITPQSVVGHLHQPHQLRSAYPVNMDLHAAPTQIARASLIASAVPHRASAPPPRNRQIQHCPANRHLQTRLN